MEHTVKWMRPSPPGVQQVWRAKFSAISGPEIRAAMVRRLAQCMQLAFSWSDKLFSMLVSIGVAPGIISTSAPCPPR